MNRTSRTDEPYEGEQKGYNQSPNPLSADLTTNQDLKGIVDGRTVRRGTQSPSLYNSALDYDIRQTLDPDAGSGGARGSELVNKDVSQLMGSEVEQAAQSPFPHSPPSNSASGLGGDEGGTLSWGNRLKNGIFKFCSFIGPGFLIAVAYIDPGNYSTGVAAGATYQFKLLFVVLMANLFAIFLQTLCIKLGTVSGLNLAQACRAFLPRWANFGLYFFAEVAIIATDIAEVIGFAIALNLLIPAIPLVAGCAISILDVMLILLFYQPHGSMKGLRVFESFIVLLVLGVVICFCIQLSLIRETNVGSIFRGYLPSSAITEQKGLYQACGILGATVMPHSLYLGSGIVQPRLRSFDAKHDLIPENIQSSSNDSNDINKGYYIPSLRAIRHCYRASAIELAIALFTFALFVNSSIVIVSGVSLHNKPDASEADIFSIHKLLSESISSVAGTIFALALLLSGVSAGIVCTITGQMVSEGALNWRLRPWLRRLVTRGISIIPSVVIAAAVGRSGLNDALNASQVVLSIILPFVSAPLIYFTCLNKYMTVKPGGAGFGTNCDRETTRNRNEEALARDEIGSVKMANSWLTAAFAVLLWLVITVLNVANLVLLGLSK
ncbi:unnamed protein product [Fusarium graminearum]|uniref:Uncharacterized protein n=1 Tax=Gibberella zeae TaxID=5518 RepID=A0A8H3JRF7_GIBZA|nr:hypothetical protein HG531_013706 [Fusarium graminearum]CAF3557475.1 unnamed protein product [Fusarium graminearum]CAG1972671.1 unnamed protein product [Fusarium graminearum]CAG1973736.1 unnamed protein product [Fusarium graminearum]CAG1999457.1 unnamed protein product [Fusarium graminearum]